MNAIQTDRLIGRPLAADDYARLRLLHEDRRVMEMLSVSRRPHPPRRTESLIKLMRFHWRRHGFGLWLFEDRAEGAFIGYCGLRWIVLSGRDELECLWAVRSDYWRRGLGTEMAKGVLARGAELDRAQSAVAFTLPHNRASRALMEKTGFRYERDIQHAGLAHVLYRRAFQRAPQSKSRRMATSGSSAGGMA